MDAPIPLIDNNIGDARVYATRDYMVRGLAGRLEGGAVAELGVAFGDFSQFLLDTLKPRLFDGYDIFDWTDDVHSMGHHAGEMFQGRTHHGFYKHRFKEQIAAGQVRVFKGDSSTKLKKADVTYDMIYVDGDHTYEGVKRDIDAALGKIAPNGVLIFNDYTMVDPFNDFHYGVVQAVNELCRTQNWRVIGFALQENMFCDIALEKTP